MDDKSSRDVRKQKVCRAGAVQAVPCSSLVSGLSFCFTSRISLDLRNQMFQLNPSWQKRMYSCTFPSLTGLPEARVHTVLVEPRPNSGSHRVRFSVFPNGTIIVTAAFWSSRQKRWTSSSELSELYAIPDTGSHSTCEFPLHYDHFHRKATHMPSPSPSLWSSEKAAGNVGGTRTQLLPTGPKYSRRM